MYDNSATFALSGSAVTILGTGAGYTFLTVIGVLVLTLGVSLAAAERLKRRSGS